MQRAVHNLAKDDGKQVTVKVAHSISQGYYCKLNGDTPNPEYLSRLKAEMMRMAEENIPIQKKSISTDDAVELFRNSGMHDKERLFSYRRSSKVNIYSIGHYTDYFYGYMVPSTGYLKKFQLMLYENGFLIRFPDRKNPDKILEFTDPEKISGVFMEQMKWCTLMGVNNVADLNEVITDGKFGDLVRINEALHEKKVAEIADKIYQKRDKVKIVLIAGPSSSGKTTDRKSVV